MSETEKPGVDQLLERLEAAIAKLADGRADLDQVVAAYDEARRLAGEAEVELEALRVRLSPSIPPAEAPPPPFGGTSPPSGEESAFAHGGEESTP